MHAERVRLGRLPLAFGVLVVVAAVLPTRARALPNFENLEDRWEFVGEARYTTLSGTDSCSTNADNLKFLVYGIHRDETTADGSQVTFSITLSASNNVSSSCPSGTLSTWTASMIVDSANPGWGCSGDSCLAYGGKEFGVHGLPFRRYWKSVISVGASGGCSTTDTGCWEVYDQNACNLVNYPYN